MIRFLRCLPVLMVVLIPAVVSAQDKFFDSNGVRIRYVEQGSGEPIVLLHGYTSNIERGWMNNGVFANLAKDHRAIAVDVRGHGKSGKPHDPKAYGAELAQDVVRLLDHLKIGKAHIVSYSMGGNITAQLLTTNPDRFLTATIGGIAGRQGTGPEGSWSAQDEKAAQAEAEELEHGMPFRSLALRIAPTDQPKPGEEDIRKFSQERAAINDVAALAALVRSRRNTLATRAQLATVQIPTQAVVGSADPNLAGVKALKAVWPALKVVVLDGATHGGERGAAARPEFVNAIRDFIAAHGKRTSD